MFQGYLTEDAVAAVKELLPESAGGNLAAVCSWPDQIRHNFRWRWSSALHYVDTPDFNCNYEYCSKFAYSNMLFSMFLCSGYSSLYELKLYII